MQATEEYKKELYSNFLFLFFNLKILFITFLTREDLKWKYWQVNMLYLATSQLLSPFYVAKIVPAEVTASDNNRPTKD